MRRFAALLVVALIATPNAARAQWGYGWVGGGLSIPTGDSGDALESGWLGTAGLGVSVTTMKGLSLQGEFNFGSHTAKVGNGSTTLTGFFGNVAYDWNEDAEWHPYAYAGVGSLSRKPTGGSSKSDGAFQLGAGFSYKARPKLNIWGDLRYVSSGSGTSKYTAMPITVGISCPLGGK